MNETITFTFEARWVWGIGLSLGLLLLIIAVALILPSTPDKVPFDQFKERMGLKKVPDVVIAFGAAFLIAVLALSVQALFAAYAVSAHTINSLLSETPAPATETSGPSLGAGTLIIGLLGAPFLIWRTLVAQRTVDIAQENHITDLINKAVEGLGSEKVVRVQLRHDDGSYMTEPVSSAKDAKSKPLMTEYTTANIEVRIGAILALERLAQKNLDVHIQIMEILTAYIRQNAKEKDRIIGPRESYEFLRGEGYEDDEVRVKLGIGSDKLEEAEDNWLRSIPRPRADISMALFVIGRREVRQRMLETRLGFRLDLRDTNLQRADLAGQNWDRALFQRSDLAGALCHDSSFSKANFHAARHEAAEGLVRS